MVWPGHVLAPGLCLALIKAWVFLSQNPGTLLGVARTHAGRSGTRPGGPVCIRGGPGPCPEVRSVYAGVRHFPMGVRTHR
jgi:hypothetical protein